MKNKAFTLIELLVVIVIIGILSGIGISQFSEYQNKARLAKSRSSFAQIKKLFLAGNAISQDQSFSAWYSFDDDNDINQSNPYIIDVSSRGNNLLFSGGGGTFSSNTDTGIGSGNSLRIDSRELGSAGIVDGGAIDKFTIAFWFKISDYEIDSNYTYPVFFNSSAGFKLYQNNRLGFYVNGAAELTTNSNIFQRNQWHYIVGSYNGNSMKLWLDGDLVMSNNGLPLVTPFAGANMYLGYANITQRFNGWLDEVMFLPYAFDGENLN